MAEAMWIGGEWVTGDESLDVINPATEELVASVSVASDKLVSTAVEAAAGAWRSWSRRPAVERGRLLRNWADLVERDKELLARTISGEVGKPITESRGEVDFGNSWFRYYAEFERRIEGEILPADRPNEQLWIIPQSLGVVSAIIPWNYPLAVAIRKIAPALIAGNTIVLKPHEETPLSALALAKLAAEAGIPPGVVNIVTGPGKTVGEALVKHPVPQLITFTGSVATGKRIAKNAADNVTLVSLELGGRVWAIYEKVNNCGPSVLR